MPAAEPEDVTIEGVAMYRRMAQSAMTAANQAEDSRIRNQYLDAAAHWFSLAGDMEKFCASGR